MYKNRHSGGGEDTRASRGRCRRPPDTSVRFVRVVRESCDSQTVAATRFHQTLFELCFLRLYEIQEVDAPQPAPQPAPASPQDAAQSLRHSV